eukprot:649461-Rhodomonas_salina.1
MAANTSQTKVTSPQMEATPGKTEQRQHVSGGRTCVDDVRHLGLPHRISVPHRSSQDRSSQYRISQYRSSQYRTANFSTAHL